RAARRGAAPPAACRRRVRARVAWRAGRTRPTGRGRDPCGPRRSGARGSSSPRPPRRRAARAGPTRHAPARDMPRAGRDRARALRAPRGRAYRGRADDFSGSGASKTWMPKRTVGTHEEWAAARAALHEREQELGALDEELASQRAELPWVPVAKEYVFDTEEGRKTLAELFDGRSQLLIYHLMFGPTYEAACPGCTGLADHFDAALVHLSN